MEAFKEVFNKKFLEEFSKHLQKIYQEFNSKKFIDEIFKNDWINLELKQRMYLISNTLNKFLPNDFEISINILLKYVQRLDDIKTGMSLAYMFIPDYIEKYGINDFNNSVRAIEIVTQYTSCEFAVRPFIVKYPSEMMQQMFDWSNHLNPAVRRLSSEGCRSRLPWAMSLPCFKSDPSPILPILENLKNDDSLFVRKSVANNLNDISKDNPQIVIDLAKVWKNKNQNTDWILKQACRTLLKQRNKEVLNLFGFIANENISIENFKILNKKIKVGDYLNFCFDLINNSDKEIKIRLEYCVYYQKANGNLNAKIYKISEKIFEKKSKTQIARKQSFKEISTRKFHLGKHQISIIYNGIETEKIDFELLV